MHIFISEHGVVTLKLQFVGQICQSDSLFQLFFPKIATITPKLYTLISIVILKVNLKFWNLEILFWVDSNAKTKKRVLRSRQSCCWCLNQI